MNIRELEKEYNVDFKEKRNIKVSTWLRKKGFKNMAKVLDRLDKIKQ